MFTAAAIIVLAAIVLPLVWPWLAMPITRALYGSPVTLAPATVEVVEIINRRTGEIVMRLEIPSEDMLPVIGS